MPQKNLSYIIQKYIPEEFLIYYSKSMSQKNFSYIFLKKLPQKNIFYVIKEFFPEKFLLYN